MNSKVLCVLFIVISCILVGINANKKKRDPCQFLTTDAYLPSELKACFRKIPLNRDVKKQTLSIIRRALRMHPYADILSQFDYGIDSFQELNRIEKKHYKSDFAFHYDLARMYQHYPDTSSYYTPPAGYTTFVGALPFTFEANKNTNNIIAKLNPRFTFPVPEEAYGKTVVSVDGISILEFLNSVSYFPSSPLAGNINRFLALGARRYLYYYGSYIHRDYQTWKFSDGSRYELGVHIQPLINITSTDQLKALNNKPVAAPTPKRSESPKMGLEIFDKKHLVVKSEEDKKPGYTCIVVSSATAVNKSVTTGIASCKGDEVPYLIVDFFPNSTNSDFKSIVLQFVNAIAERKSPVAFIDVTNAFDSGSAYAYVVEWTVNVLAGTYVQPYDAQNAKSNSYRTLYAARTTDSEAKELLYALYSDVAVDPSSSLGFHDPHCIAEAEEESHKVTDIYHPPQPPKYSYGYNKPSHKGGDKDGDRDGDKDGDRDGEYDNDKKKRYEPVPPTPKQRETFSPKFYLENNNEFLNLPQFTTKYLISISDTSCYDSCGILANALRQLNKAKLFGVGGVTDLDFQLTYSYAGPSIDWEADIVPKFPLDSDFFNFTTSASLTHPALESYLSDLNVPEVLKATVADEVIGWDVINPDSTPFDYFTFMLANSDIDAKVLEVPKFEAKGVCYAKHIYGYDKDK